VVHVFEDLPEPGAPFRVGRGEVVPVVSELLQELDVDLVAAAAALFEVAPAQRVTQLHAADELNTFADLRHLEACLVQHRLDLEVDELFGVLGGEAPVGTVQAELDRVTVHAAQLSGTQYEVHG